LFTSLWTFNFLDGTIHANYANFGYIPYGKTIIGKIHYDPDDEMCCGDLD
jgi:hypothetical protein